MVEYTMTEHNRPEDFDLVQDRLTRAGWRVAEMNTISLSNSMVKTTRVIWTRDTKEQRRAEGCPACKEAGQCLGDPGLSFEQCDDLHPQK